MLEIEKIMMQGKPETLYHYASTSGVAGICNSKSIWASNIHYLNDSKEYRHALELMASEIHQQRSVSSSKAQKYYSGLLDLLKRIEGSIPTKVPNAT